MAFWRDGEPGYGRTPATDPQDLMWNMAFWRDWRPGGHRDGELQRSSASHSGCGSSTPSSRSSGVLAPGGHFGVSQSPLSQERPFGASGQVSPPFPTPARVLDPQATLTGPPVALFSVWARSLLCDRSVRHLPLSGLRTTSSPLRFVGACVCSSPSRGQRHTGTQRGPRLWRSWWIPAPGHGGCSSPPLLDWSECPLRSPSWP